MAFLCALTYGGICAYQQYKETGSVNIKDICNHIAEQFNKAAGVVGLTTIVAGNWAGIVDSVTTGWYQLDALYIRLQIYLQKVLESPVSEETTESAETIADSVESGAGEGKGAVKNVINAGRDYFKMLILKSQT